MSDSSEHIDYDIKCACPACSGTNYYDPVEGTSGVYYDDPTSAPSTYGTAQQMSDQLVTGYWQYSGGSADTRQWVQDTVTFSFGSGYSSAEQDSFRMAFDLWAEVADIAFQEVVSSGDIHIVEGSDGGAYSSSSYYGGSGDIVSNTISIDTDTGSWSDLTTIGRYGVTTVLHEIGHSLGLGHQGNYNGNVNYDDPDQVWFLNDNRQYSLMSYNNADLLGTDHWAQNGVWQYAATPMLYDIMAIQQIYGANTSTRSGNTTYGFNSNAGHAQYDLSVSSAPFAIWDGAGNDTLDLSGYTTNQTITLVEGEFTSAGYMTNNIVIAYGAVIENASGGAGNDTIYGNSADNIILGNAGADTLYGSTGSDTLNGGDDNDTVIYNYNISDFLVLLADTATITLQHIGELWTDTLISIESFQFTNDTYSFAQMAEMDASDVSRITVRFIWDGGNYTYYSDKITSDTVGAVQMGHPGAYSNAIDFARDVNGLTITTRNDSAASELRIYANEEGDAIIFNNNYAGFNAVVTGASGNDDIQLLSSQGGNIVYGYGGDDNVIGANGDDKIYGHAGADTLYGRGGSDVIYGGEGNDYISGGAGNDFLYGGVGNDEIYGDEGADIIYGHDGEDILYGGDGNDRIYGGNHNDTIHGGAGNDYLYGELGNDVIYGDDGHDRIYGGAGDDILYGGAGSDRLYGGDGNDTINGGADNDFLYGQNGADTLNGEGGSDRIFGGAGNDIIQGGDGNDLLYGGADSDILYGGAGNDRMEGGDGNDTLIAGTGSNILVGGAGLDTFMISNTTDAYTRIYDFSTVDDTLDIADLLSGYNHGVDDLADFVQTREVFAGTFIEIDRDGAGGGSGFEKVVLLSGTSGLGTAQNLVNNGDLTVTGTALQDLVGAGTITI